MTQPIDQKEGYIWIDGEFIEWKEAKVHFLTHGLHYASSVFEGERAYNGKVFKLKEHNDRLIKSAEILDMKSPYTAREIDTAVKECLIKNDLNDAYVRPLIWRGSESMGMMGRHCKTHVGIACWKWPSYFGAELMEKGISLCIGNWKKPHPETAPIEAKASGLYTIETLTKHYAIDKGFHDALMLDWEGLVAECTGMNLFFVMENDEIVTPLADRFLNGITRQAIIQMAKDKGYTITEKRMKLDEVWEAKEVFVTGTAAEVTPVGRIEDKIYKVGNVTKDLKQTFEALVRS